jgi:RimJ/RimL family protein N-acetyltransferase
MALNDMALNDMALNDMALNDMALNDMALNDMALNDMALDDMALGDLAPDALEIGYSVFPTYRRRGYAAAAASALIQWANMERGIKFFVASINHENAASQRVAAKVGFKFYRDFDPTDPEREDIYTMHLGSDKA